MEGHANNTSFVVITNSSNSSQWGELLFWGMAPFVIGLCGIVVNVLTVAVIVNNKKLRSPCFGLIAGHSVFCSIMSIGFVTNGYLLLSLVFNWSDLVYSRLSCYLRYVTYLSSVPPSSVMTCVIGLDRTFGILCPKLYQRKGRKFAIVSLIILFSVGVVAASSAILTAPRPLSDNVFCYNMFAPLHPTFTLTYTNFNLAFNLLSVLVYASIFAVVKYRKFKQNTTQQPNSISTDLDRFLQRQLKLLPMINTLMIAYMFFGVIPPLITSSFAAIANGKYLPRVSQYAVVMKAALPSIDFWVLIIKSADFHATLKKWTRNKTNVVVPVIVTNSAQ